MPHVDRIRPLAAGAGFLLAGEIPASQERRPLFEQAPLPGIPALPPLQLSRGLWRPAAARIPLSTYAAALAAQGRVSESHLLFRAAFARGERSPAIDAAIDAISARALKQLGRIDLHLPDPSRKSGQRDVVVEDVASGRDLFERQLHSSLTLMDLVDLLRLSAPAVRTKGVDLQLELDTPGTGSLSIYGAYKPRMRCREPHSFSLTLLFDQGRPSIEAANIHVHALFKGLGIGTVQMLRLVQMARMHGIGAWVDHITHDGTFLWPRLGARVTQESMDYVREKLGRLVSSGAVRALDLDADSIPAIAAIRLEQEDILNRRELLKWYGFNTRIHTSHVETLSPPYEVGIDVLLGTPLYAIFEPRRMIASLLQGALPRRLRALRDDRFQEQTLLPQRDIAAAETALAHDINRALVREWTMRGVDAEPEGVEPEIVEPANRMMDSGMQLIGAEMPGIWMPDQLEIVTPGLLTPFAPARMR